MSTTQYLPEEELIDQALRALMKALTSLKRALAGGRRPDIHHSDQGIHYLL